MSLVLPGAPQTKRCLPADDPPEVRLSVQLAHCVRHLLVYSSMSCAHNPRCSLESQLRYYELVLCVKNLNHGIVSDSK